MAIMWWIVTSFIILLNNPDSVISPKPKEQIKERRVNLTCVSPKDLMTDDIQKSVLSNLNFQRRLVAELTNAGKLPVAFPMSDLQWDKNLAENAKADAMKCPLVPLISFKFTKIRSEKIGQAIALKIWDRDPPTVFLVDELLVRYSSSAARMSDEKITKLIHNYQPGDWDSGYQIIWEATKKIGCSYVSYRTVDAEMMEKDPLIDSTSVSLNLSFRAIVCNFSPAGCIKGEKVYRIKIEPKPTEPSTTTFGPVNCSPVRVLGSLSASPLMLTHALNILYYYMNE